LRELGVARLDLDYRELNRVDRHGNLFKYRAKVKDTRGAQVGRWAWDVVLARVPAPGAAAVPGGEGRCQPQGGATSMFSPAAGATPSGR
jgi:hypothetical protein